MKTKTKDAIGIVDALQPLSVPVSDLQFDPANARTHSPRNIEAIKASLQRFGQRLPIVVQREGMIVRAGNARLEAVRQLGWTEIAAVVVDDDSMDAIAFALADNRTSELAEWDTETLTSLFNTPDLDIDDNWFDAADIQSYLADVDSSTDDGGLSGESVLGDIEYTVTVTCSDELQQREVLELLRERSYECRAIML